ncbi:ankyrin repeat domain-containing protein [Streptomyces sp. NRRL WC-3742]|uniref:ankyrin repeat domain-containing protein n=1 Tax=Streptomyces sp. NRRL WC-3742 TaxID=1463934 RepID=UPI0004C58069|nr:ankyrin repeat domain-containing protein [Streptomyces sp. NRRL WC-3742]
MTANWDGLHRGGRQDVGEIRARLAAGADPDPTGGSWSPLRQVAVYGTPEGVAELARHVPDLGATDQGGTTALWEAVTADRPDNARALVAAGADPWKAELGGWSPGRLALAGPVPDLFPLPDGQPGLSAAERAAVERARRLTASLGKLHVEGTGLACVAGIDATEAIRRLGAEPVEDEEYMDEFLEQPWAYPMGDGLRLAGVTTVPGGCVVTQPWGYAPYTAGAAAALTPGTVGYALYANPKSGNQGMIQRDGKVESWDLHPGGGPWPGDGPEEVLAAYLYRGRAVAYACAFAGLEPEDARAVTGPADVWVRLPEAYGR